MVRVHSAILATTYPSASFKDELALEFEAQALPLLHAVHRYALRLTKSEVDAQDLVQETYLKAFRNFHTFESGTNLRAWIFRILKNTHLSSLDKPHNRQAARFNRDLPLTELPSDYLDPLSQLIYRARHEALRTAAKRLPAIFHEVLVLCDFEDSSYREAAETLSIPLGTVMSRLARARKAVCESIRDL